MTQQLNRYIAMIDSAMEEYLPKPLHSDSNFSVREAMRYTVMNGGKRIRPVLTLAFAELSGAKAEDALPFACAVEMIHSYSLIHDDLPCMDNDKLRRGKPANHIAFGENIALLAGDALLTEAFAVAASSMQDAGSVLKGIALLAELSGAEGMVGGQCIDLEHEDKPMGLELLQEMDRKKTAALISAGCQLGCIAAGAGDILLEVADSYALSLGLAFQIRDDVLGAIGDSKLLGKTVGLDSANNKSNYVSTLGVEESQALVEKYTAQALESLDAFPGDKSFLSDFTYSLVDRKI